METTPRLQFIERDFAIRTLSIFEECASEARRSLREAIRDSMQGAYSSLAGHLVQVARYRYVVGKNIAEVREPLVAALSSYLEVFRLYGTERRKFPAIDMSISSVEPIEDTYARRIVAGEADSGIDYAYTGSGPSRRALELAVVVGSRTTREQLAGIITGVMETELSRDSEYWSSELEPAIVGCIAARLKRAAHGVMSFKDGRVQGNEKVLLYESQTLVEISEGSKAAFLRCLEEWLLWNESRAKDRANLDRSEFFFSIPALASCELAIEAGIVDWDDLPVNNVYLPIGLLRSDD